MKPLTEEGKSIIVIMFVLVIFVIVVAATITHRPAEPEPKAYYLWFHEGKFDYNILREYGDCFQDQLDERGHCNDMWVINGFIKVPEGQRVTIEILDNPIETAGFIVNGVIIPGRSIRLEVNANLSIYQTQPLLTLYGETLDLLRRYSLTVVESGGLDGSLINREIQLSLPSLIAEAKSKGETVILHYYGVYEGIEDNWIWEKIHWFFFLDGSTVYYTKLYV